MDKEYNKWLFKKKFKYLPKDFKLILYRNPKEFIWFYLERVNPNHIIDIFGLPKKKNRKDGTLKYYRVGKIILSLYAGTLSFTFITEYIYLFLYYTSIIYLTLIMLVNVIEMENKNVNRNRGRTRWGKNTLNG
jgi:hypothetical protein